MYCRNCGSAVPSSGAFCDACGSQIKENGTYLEQMLSETPVENPPGVKGETSSKVAMGIACAGIIVFALVVVSSVAGGIRIPSVRIKNNAQDTVVSNQDTEEVVADMAAEQETESIAADDETELAAVEEEEMAQEEAADEESLAETEEEVMAEETSDYILPTSDSAYLSVSDLEGLTAEECRLARNEIYARHGRMFDDEELQAYFNQFDWYEGTIAPSDFQESWLNDYEVANRDLIVSYETEQGYR